MHCGAQCSCTDISSEDGRRVGLGTYKVYIQAKWPGGISNEVTALIKVKPKETTKK